MSYCRFSNDDFQCDVYVYESCYGGFDIHIARRRIKFKEPIPEIVPFNDEHKKEWFKRHQKILKMCGEANRVVIGLPFDGDSENYDTAAECAERLKELKQIGYNVPQYAINGLVEESKSKMK